VEESDRREAEDPREEPNALDAREIADVQAEDDTVGVPTDATAPIDAPADAPAMDDDPTGEVPVTEALVRDAREDAERDGRGVERGAEGEAEGGAEVADLDEFRRRLEAKDRHVRGLYEELAAAKLAADEARARLGAGEVRARDLEEERERLRERVREFEEEERVRRRRREGQDRRAARLEREIERREDDIRRLEDVLARREAEMSAYGQETQGVVSRKDVALEDALRRVEGLERDLEEREDEVVNLKQTIDQMRAEIDLEYELRRRMADPANRLRAGIDLFNDSEHLREIGQVSRSLGRPEVYVALERGESDEPPVILIFTWGGVTWRTYAANPGIAVQEPRVYLQDADEDLSGVDQEDSNAHVGPGGRVILGL
jgi:ribonuclease Y